MKNGNKKGIPPNDRDGMPFTVSAWERLYQCIANPCIRKRLLSTFYYKNTT